jgi:hypothetical protein
LLADHAGVTVAVADVGEAADVRHHFAEVIGPLPGDGERTNAAARDAANRVSRGVGSDIVVLADLGEDLGEQELGVVVRERVVFEATVFGLRVPAWLGRQLGFILPTNDKNAHTHPHLAHVNKNF